MAVACIACMSNRLRVLRAVPRSCVACWTRCVTRNLSASRTACVVCHRWACGSVDLTCARYHSLHACTAGTFGVLVKPGKIAIVSVKKKNKKRKKKKKKKKKKKRTTTPPMANASADKVVNPAPSTEHQAGAGDPEGVSLRYPAAVCRGVQARPRPHVYACPLSNCPLCRAYRM